MKGRNAIAGRRLDWREVPNHPSWNVEPDAVIWVDPVKFDQAWQRSDQWISPFGKQGAQDDRYPQVGRWIEDGNPIEMCCAGIEGEAVSFVNGRHRFAWLRDQGVKAIPMQVPPEDAAQFERICGTHVRQSVLPDDKLQVTREAQPTAKKVGGR